MLRNGDWARLTLSACFSVSSKTGSPVEFVKSARTTLSRSVSRAACRERQYKKPVAAIAITISDATSIHFKNGGLGATVVTTWRADAEAGGGTCIVRRDSVSR